MDAKRIQPALRLDLVDRSIQGSSAGLTAFNAGSRKRPADEAAANGIPANRARSDLDAPLECTVSEAVTVHSVNAYGNNSTGFRSQVTALDPDETPSGTPVFPAPNTASNASRSLYESRLSWHLPTSRSLSVNSNIISQRHRDRIWDDEMSFDNQTFEEHIRSSLNEYRDDSNITNAAVDNIGGAVSDRVQANCGLGTTGMSVQMAADTTSTTRFSGSTPQSNSWSDMDGRYISVDQIRDTMAVPTVLARRMLHPESRYDEFAIRNHLASALDGFAHVQHSLWESAVIRMLQAPQQHLSFRHFLSIGMMESEIAQLESFSLSNPEALKEKLCVICQCDFENREMIRVLPCAHHFHLKCIDKWLRDSRNCPVCRRSASMANFVGARDSRIIGGRAAVDTDVSVAGVASIERRAPTFRNANAVMASANPSQFENK